MGYKPKSRNLKIKLILYIEINLLNYLLFYKYIFKIYMDKD